MLGILRNGDMPGLREWETLERKEQAKILRVIKDQLGDEGKCWDKERFRHEGDGIWAIKGGQVRVYCFMTSNRLIVLTNAGIKKRPKARPQDLKRAKDIRKIAIQWTGQGAEK